MKTLSLTVQIPDIGLTHAEAAKTLLEHFIRAEFQTGRLTLDQAVDILGLSRPEVETLLRVTGVIEFECWDQ